MGGRGQWLDSGIHTETIQMGVLEPSLANGMDATLDLFFLVFELCGSLGWLLACPQNHQSSASALPPLL